MSSIATNYNIKQVTNNDVDSSMPSTTYTVSMPKRIYDSAKREWVIKMVNEEIEYKTILSGVEIIKLGYCCEPKGNMYPIYLETNNGGYREFKIGKDGMYEMQPEDWLDTGNVEQEERTTNVKVTGVKVPVGIGFTLDYVVSVN